MALMKFFPIVSARVPAWTWSRGCDGGAMTGNIGNFDEGPIGDRSFGLDDPGKLFGTEFDISQHVRDPTKQTIFQKAG